MQFLQSKITFPSRLTPYPSRLTESPDPPAPAHSAEWLGLEIDDQFELRRLLDGQVGGLGTLEDLIDIRCGAPE